MIYPSTSSSASSFIWKYASIYFGYHKLLALKCDLNIHQSIQMLSFLDLHLLNGHLKRSIVLLVLFVTAFDLLNFVLFFFLLFSYCFSGVLSGSCMLKTKIIRPTKPRLDSYLCSISSYSKPL